MFYILLGYDEDWYTFETFKGVFSTRENAEKAQAEDFEIYDDEKVFNHSWYKILEVDIDKVSISNV